MPLLADDHVEYRSSTMELDVGRKGLAPDCELRSARLDQPAVGQLSLDEEPGAVVVADERDPIAVDQDPRGPATSSVA